jgi:hypothetical protein
MWIGLGVLAVCALLDMAWKSLWGAFVGLFRPSTAKPEPSAIPLVAATPEEIRLEQRRLRRLSLRAQYADRINPKQE